MSTQQKDPAKVVTGRVRFSYAHLFEPHAFEEGQDKKFSVTIIIPKKDKVTLEKIRKAMDFITEDVKKQNGGKLPKKWWNPLRDGDEDKEGDEVFEDSYFMNLSTKKRPNVVDESLEPIMDADEFYSGCYGRASFKLAVFDKNGNKGVSCFLNNVQKLEDGERLGGGGSTAEEDFGDDEI